MMLIVNTNDRYWWDFYYDTRSGSRGQRSRTKSWFGENFVLAVDHEPFVGLNSNLVYMLSIYCQWAVSRSRSSDDVSRSNSPVSNQQAFLVITQILLVGLKPNLVWGLTSMKATHCFKVKVIGSKVKFVICWKICFAVLQSQTGRIFMYTLEGIRACSLNELIVYCAFKVWFKKFTIFK